MIYYTYSGKYWEKFYNYTQLINWLSQYNRDWACEDYNSFLDYVGVTENDIRYGVMQHGFTCLTDGTKEWFIPHRETVAVSRDHRIYQEDFISIYCEKLKNNVRVWRYVESIEHERKIRLKEDKEWQNLLTQFYGSRRRKRYWWEHRHFHHWGHYAPGAPLRDQRDAADPEQKPYIRASRNLNNLPNRWDDKWNRCSCNWKEQGKCRHQWEHNVISKNKHTKPLN